MKDSLLSELRGITLNITQRVSSPMLGSFLVSFLVINWRLFLFLFWGKDSSIDTIANIEKYYSQFSFIQNFILFFIGPTISMLTYIFIYPLPARFIYTYHKKQSEVLLKIRNEIENKRLLTEEDSNELKIKIQQLRNNFGDLLKDKDNEISVLKNLVNQLQNTQSLNFNNNESSKSENENDFNNFKDKEIYSIFEKYLDKFSNGIQISGIHLTQEQLSDLRLVGLIKIIGAKYHLTDKGRDFARRIKGF